MPSTRRERRREDIEARIQCAQPAFGSCAVLGCEHPSDARAGRGLNRAYCRRHAEHYRRHGSYSKPSYTAQELRVYRKAALRWLKDHSNHQAVREAREAVLTLYLRGGAAEEAFRLSGKPPAERAGKIWARIRAKGIDPAVPLEIWLAIQLRHQDDPQSERKLRYRLVQAAKGVHRLAGGTHKRWEQLDDRGQVRVVELHKYPASRGLVLWHLGTALARAARPLEAYLTEVREYLSDAARSGAGAD